MRAWSSTFVMCGVAAAGLAMLGTALADERKPQVVVISLDGARPDVIDAYRHHYAVGNRGGPHRHRHRLERGQ
jgi:predicted AlkP superfamily pyrophosphatase or phosphodiesterase